jgi:exosortase/archaeosortase family protein
MINQACREAHINNKQRDDFLTENFGLFKFYSMAAIIFGAFLILYSSVIIESDLFFRYLEVSAELASELLNAVLRLDSYLVMTSAGVKSKIEVSSGAYVIVAQGCDASVVFATLLATIMAWPGKIMVKCLVAAVGLLLMFGLNVMRIAGMLLTDIYLPDHFDFVHEWIMPAGLVLAALLYFYGWVVVSGEHPNSVD